MNVIFPIISGDPAFDLCIAEDETIFSKPKYVPEIIFDDYEDEFDINSFDFDFDD